MKLSNWLIILCFFHTASVVAQEKTIPLWAEGSAPYLKDGDGGPTLNLYPAADGNGAAVVVCPGGGYGGLAKDHEGHQIARWYNDRGVSAYVLHYRLGSQGYHFPTQLADVQRAMRMVRGNAKEWKVDPERIGVMGFSAGGHLASMAATKFDEKAYDPVDEIDKLSARPDFAVLCYAVISMDSVSTHSGSRRNLLGPDKKDDPAAATHVSSDKNITANTPPTFLFHTDEDGAVPSENSILFYLGLRKHKIPAEMHIYQKGPHGVGLFEGDPILGTWSGHLEDWLRSNGFFAAKEFEQAAVSGTLNLDGKPVSWGTVTFYPQDRTLPVVTTRVRRGKFSAKKESGPVIAKSSVELTGSIWEETGNAADKVVEHTLAETVNVTDGAKFEWEYTK
ncbi:MAG: alpha/beta hydrolase [Verrucomicrobiales bacterium]|nr:alpha/beta hydrolase [Verrucomicrobiales bacterium]